MVTVTLPANSPFRGDTLMFARIDNEKKPEPGDAPSANAGQKPVIFKVRLTLGNYVVKEEYVALYPG